jgi:hypothetical protein
MLVTHGIRGESGVREDAGQLVVAAAVAVAEHTAEHTVFVVGFQIALVVTLDIAASRGGSP